MGMPNHKYVVENQIWELQWWIFLLNNDFSLFSLFLTPSYRMTLEDYEHSAQVEHFNGDRYGHDE